MRITRTEKHPTILVLNLMAIAAALLLTACMPGEPAAAPATATPSAPDTAAIVDSALSDSEWLLTSLGGQPPLDGSRVTLEFDGLTVGGNAGCNSYGADIRTVADGVFQLGGVSRTEMACEEPAGVMALEEAYLDALSDSSAYHLQDDTLTLLNEAGTALLVYGRKEETPADPAVLIGSGWRLVSNNGQPVDVRRPITLVLGESRYWGQSECRSYVGSYQATADDIAFPSSSMLGEPCADEQLFLPENGDYQLLDDRLTLTSARGDIYSYEPLSSGDAGNLVGTKWQLLAFVGPDATPAVIEEPLPGTGINASFEANGTVSGSAGCNSYFGDYETTGDTFSVTNVGATEAFCEEPEGVMEQEGRYLSWLEEATHFQRAGDLLWLEVAGGRALLFVEAS